LPSKHANIDFSANHYWQFMLGFPIILVFVQTLALVVFFPYETPKYLIQTGNESGCQTALERIYRSNEKIVVIKEHIHDCLKGEASNEVSLIELFNKTHIKALIVVLCMLFYIDLLIVFHMFQQLAGGNAFMMYSTTIFNANHAEETVALIGTVMAGVTAVIGVSIFTFFVDSKLSLGINC